MCPQRSLRPRIDPDTGLQATKTVLRARSKALANDPHSGELPDPCGALSALTESPKGCLISPILLLVDQTLPELFVRRSLAPDRSYDIWRGGGGGSDARGRILQGDRVFEYAADAEAPGRYLPPTAPPMVEPRTEYQLEVEVEGQRFWGRTTTRAGCGCGGRCSSTRRPGRFCAPSSPLPEPGTGCTRRRRTSSSNWRNCSRSTWRRSRRKATWRRSSPWSGTRTRSTRTWTSSTRTTRT